MANKAKEPFSLLENSRVASVANYVLFTVRRFYRDGLFQSVAALTYSTLLALVPLLVIAFSIFSAFQLQFSANSKNQRKTGYWRGSR